MISKNQNTWICPRCHTVNAMGNRKCVCGERNPHKEVFVQANSALHSAGGSTRITEPRKSWFCPECGRKNSLNYCPVCGTKNPIT